MRRFLPLIALLAIIVMAPAQNIDDERYASAFDAAYEACPNVPRGVLEAVSFINTHCHHLTDADYHHDGPDAMPRAYGLMGLVKDGKGYFRENLHTVARLSGMAETDILASPASTVTVLSTATPSMMDDDSIAVSTTSVALRLASRYAAISIIPTKATPTQDLIGIGTTTTNSSMQTRLNPSFCKATVAPSTTKIMATTNAKSGR